MNTLKACVPIVILLLSGPNALAQLPGDIVQWTAKTTPASVRAGQKATATLAARIADGWHVYSITQAPGGPVKTEISVPPDRILKASGDVVGPKPQTAFDPNFKMNAEFYEKTVTFQVPVQIDASAKPGEVKGTIDVRFQACNDRLCLPPTKVHVPVTFTVAARR